MDQKKIKNAKHNKFEYDEILKLTIKSYSNISKINLCYYLKHRIPKMHRQFFKLGSQNLDYVKTHCIEEENLLNFAIRSWMNKQEN